MMTTERLNSYCTMQTKTVPVRPGSFLDEDGELPDDGYRYRYACTCGRRGRWFRNPNDASEASEQHLYAAHGYGD